MSSPSPALHELSAAELIAGYRSRAFSPVEVARAVLGHIELWEHRLQALYLLRPELALQQARASESRWLRGAPLGPLDGVPVTLKDNIATQGDPLPLGTAASELSPMPADAPPAARVREAGGVIVSKTTMPDYGMLSSGLSSFHKLARNPWDLAKTPGGSSSGAAAAAAAGYGPLHIGTDIGGSLRLPAGWCGIFTLKPSLGRIPIDPPYTGRAAGPMTRRVADSAWFMQVLSLPDARDSMSLPYQQIPWDRFDAGVEKLKGLRIGLLLEGDAAARKDALVIIADAPSPELRPEVAPFVHEPAGRAALLAIEDVPQDPAGPAAWRDWIAGRAAERTAPAIEALLEVAVGKPPAGTPARPDEASWLAVRRSAIQWAREMVRYGTRIPDDPPSALVLLRDPDPQIRRDAVRLLAAAAGPVAQSWFPKLMRSDPDADVRLAAQAAAP